MREVKLAAVLGFVWALMGCDNAAEVSRSSEDDLHSDGMEGYIDGVKKRLVFVEGGVFWMGDYGVEYGPEGLPYDLNEDSKPVHEVKLSNFSIGAYKITNQEYQFYLEKNGLQLRQLDDRDWRDINSEPNTPAHLDWYEAQKYCSWLASVTSLPFHLPAEAQWEYAARSRGQFLMVATDDGTYRTTNTPHTETDGPRGINISTWRDRKSFAKRMGWKTGLLTPLPVDMFPPNPLGLYAMSDNGFEWVEDWYDPDYYKKSPFMNPSGPDKPVFQSIASNFAYAKVLRGADHANPQWGGAVNLQRRYGSPDGLRYSQILKKSDLLISNKTARCVVNSAEKVM